MWICSLVVIVMANILPGDFDLLTLIASCIGVTSLVLAAKGNVWSQILWYHFLAIPLLGGNDHLSGNDDADGYSFMMSMVLSVGRKENGKSPFRL